MALSKVSLGAKQISYTRESVKAVVEKLLETSVTNALDKKAEWTKQIKDVEDTELKQAMKDTLESVLIILNRTFPFPYSSVPSALSLAESTSMTLPKGLIPSSIMMKRNS